MSPQSEDAPSPNSAVEPVTDPESLRDRGDVPFHEDVDAVPEETFETIRKLDDLALVGVTNDDGEVLLRRLTETCSLKIPSIAVDPGEDFTATARREVQRNTGLSIELDALEAAWRLEVRPEGGEDRTATRHFVVYSASPTADGSEEDDPTAIPDDHEAVEVAWYDELPDEAAELPGIDLFFD